MVVGYSHVFLAEFILPLWIAGRFSWPVIIATRALTSEQNSLCLFMRYLHSIAMCWKSHLFRVTVHIYSNCFWFLQSQISSLTILNKNKKISYLLAWLMVLVLLIWIICNSEEQGNSLSVFQGSSFWANDWKLLR